jgi:hypothetical protein
MLSKTFAELLKRRSLHDCAPACAMRDVTLAAQRRRLSGIGFDFVRAPLRQKVLSLFARVKAIPSPGTLRSRVLPGTFAVLTARS